MTGIAGLPISVAGSLSVTGVHSRLASKKAPPGSPIVRGFAAHAMSVNGPHASTTTYDPSTVTGNVSAT